MQFDSNLKLANEGDVEAMHKIALHYIKGDVVPLNANEGYKWLKKASELGHVQSMRDLGLSYSEGVGHPKDLKLALYWYEKAAERGHAIAMLNLANLYKFGEGTPINYKKAFYWFEKSANKGSVKAMVNTSTLYILGEGIKPNITMAHIWASKAAEKGNQQAIRILEEIENLQEAEAAEKTNKKACYIATLVYEDIDHPKVVFLRQYRDETLSKTTLGKTFIRFYYKYAPKLSSSLKGKKHINLLIRKSLDIFIKLKRK